MSFGIYKMGQGYWVRVLSAVGVGILGLAAAAWGWGQGGAVRLPVKSYTYNITGVSGDIAPGQTVEIVAPSRVDPDELDSSSPHSVVVGEGVVITYAGGALTGGQIEVGSFTSDETRDLAFDAEVLQAGTEFSASVRQGGVQANPVFPPIYLQAGIAGAVLVLTAIGVFWFVGFGRKPVDFLVATDGEMKKVHWTTAREIRGSTIVVIVAAFLIAGLLFGVDIVFKWFFGAIDVLQA